MPRISVSGRRNKDYVLVRLPGVQFLTIHVKNLLTTLGEAHIKIMEMIYKGEINKEKLCIADGRKEMTRLFKKELKKKK